MLIEGKISTIIEAFLTQQVAAPIGSPEQQQLAIRRFAEVMEDAIYKAIKSQVITIFPGAIVTTGGANAAPIILQPELPTPNITIQ